MSQTSDRFQRVEIILGEILHKGASLRCKLLVKSERCNLLIEAAFVESGRHEFFPERLHFDVIHILRAPSPALE
jgi:hypothetical protein